MARVGQYGSATSLRDVSERYEPVTVFRWDNALDSKRRFQATSLIAGVVG
jgi:hypothetical protein